MKFIAKSSEPSIFIQWKLDNPTSDWVQFFGRVKYELKNYLLNEQGYICCYCQKRILPNQNPTVLDKKCHCEHIVPRSSDANLEFDYFNIVASCEGEYVRTRRIESHCGHFKDNNNLPISPLDSNCENFFTFSSSGEILLNPELDSDSQRKAQETIDILNLNCPILVERRKSAIEATGILDEDFTQSEITDMISAFSSKDQSGMFQPFCTAIIMNLKCFR